MFACMYLRSLTMAIAYKQQRPSNLINTVQNSLLLAVHSMCSTEYHESWACHSKTRHYLVKAKTLVQVQRDLQ